MKALLLFAHGARDPLWAAPFISIRDRLRQRGVLVELAFLDLMQPSLEEAARLLQAQGAEAIRVVPVFFGQGSHIRQDLPRLVQSAADLLQLPMAVGRTIGESEAVLDAISAECFAQFQSS